MMLQRFKALCLMIFQARSTIALIWQAYPAGFLFLLFVQLLQGVLPLGTAWITKLLFDALARALSSHNSGTAGPLNIPLMVLLLLLGLTIFTILAQFIQIVDQYFTGELGRRLALLMQSQIYRKVAGLSGLACFEDRELHNTIQLAVNGARNGPAQLLRSLMSILSSLVTLAGFLGVLLLFNPWLTALVLGATVPQFLVQWKLSKQRFGVAFYASGKERLVNYYGQILSGVPFAKEIRLFNLGDYFLRAFRDVAQSMQNAQRRQQRQELLWQTLCTGLSALVGSGAFIFVFVQAFHGLLSFGDVSLYASAVGSIQATLLSMVFASTQISTQILFYHHYTHLLAMPQPLTISTQPQEVPELTRAIELRDVSFRYSEQHPWILRHINLCIPAGQCLALVGLNGAGKTTLVKLLARLYDPCEGQVLWDDIDIREFDPVALRKRLAAIFQDFARYDLTVQENIGLGDVERMKETIPVREAARQAGIDELITQLPGGYSTLLSRWLGEQKGEPGVDLSGGQWQKIALARMFMRQGDVLMLDEPTAALDAQSEYDLHQCFADLMVGRTCLIITHRFSTVQMADIIAVLENGHITESGKHTELLELNGTYAHLYQMQASHYQATGLSASRAGE